MIPDFTQSGVLPPFIGTPTDSATMSPYQCSILDFVVKYATTPERTMILKGFLNYRKALIESGVDTGFQWCDGSFVEDVENSRDRPPNDIDLVTFSPQVENISDFLNQNKFENAKESFYCDAYFVNLNANPIYLVKQTRYWFGLFSHQRETGLWKGMLEIPLDSDDKQASDYLNEVTP